MNQGDLIQRQEAIKCLNADFQIIGKENAEEVVKFINGAYEKLNKLPAIDIYNAYNIVSKELVEQAIKEIRLEAKRVEGERGEGLTEAADILRKKIGPLQWWKTPHANYIQSTPQI